MNWKDIKLIVRLADGYLLQAKTEHWSEEDYYTKVANDYNKIKNESK